MPVEWEETEDYDSGYSYYEAIIPIGEATIGLRVRPVTRCGEVIGWTADTRIGVVHKWHEERFETPDAAKEYAVERLRESIKMFLELIET